MTLTVSTKIATLTLTNVDKIPTACQSAAMIPHVVMVRVIVIMMGNVKAHLFVAMTNVEVDHQIWTVAKVSSFHHYIYHFARVG